MSRRGKNGTPEPSDPEVRTILFSAKADVGADPALIYAFQRTGVYVSEESERGLSRSQLAAWTEPPTSITELWLGRASERYRPCMIARKLP